MRMDFIFWSAVLAAWIAGCHSAPTTVAPVSSEVGGEIADLRQLPQDCRAYLDESMANRPMTELGPREKRLASFRAAYFQPWLRTDAPSRATFLKPFEAAVTQPGYAQNGCLRSPQWASELLQVVSADEFPNCRRKGIILRNTMLRELPTLEPRYDGPIASVDGYPFDTLQMSALWAGNPVAVEHAPRETNWVYVRSLCGSGWVSADDVALVSDEFAKVWRQDRLAVIVKDRVPCRDRSGVLRFTANIGTVLPLIGMDAKTVRVKIPAADLQRNAVACEAELSTAEAAELPLELSPAKMAEVANGMLGQPYGWGGMYETRDCSATTRDLFIPFGVLLPRNSSQQASWGTVVSFAGLSPQQREETLLRRGVPWLTLLRSPGHILLYIGRRGDRAIVLQNFWGVKVREGAGEGRRFVARCCITTLSPGAELPEAILPQGDLRNRIESMILLQPAKEGQACSTRP